MCAWITCSVFHSCNMCVHLHGWVRVCVHVHVLTHVLQALFVYCICACCCLLLRGEGGREGTGGRQCDCIWTLKLQRCQPLISELRAQPLIPPLAGAAQRCQSEAVWVGRAVWNDEFHDSNIFLFFPWRPGWRWGRMLDYVGKQMFFGEFEIIFLTLGACRDQRLAGG